MNAAATFKLPTADDLRFIRAQVSEAIPLLAELYGLPIDEVKRIRMQRANGEKMPLRLLRELVQQRKAKLPVQLYIVSESPLCAAFEDAVG